MFMNGWLDAVGTHNRYAVGSVDQNAMHVVAEAMYGSTLMAPVSDVDNCDYFLLVGANPAVSAWNWLETVPGGWRRALARQATGRDDRGRRPAADRVRREGRRASGGAARTGLGAAAGDGQGHPRRGPRASRRTAPTSPTGVPTSCARWSPRPTSTTSPHGATSPRDRDRAAWQGISRPPAARWWSPAPGCRCTLAGTVARVAGSCAERDHRPDGPAGRAPIRARLRRRAAAGRAGRRRSRTRSRLRGPRHGRRRARAGRAARRDHHTRARPDPGDGDQLRQPGGLRTRRRQARRTHWRSWICWSPSTSCSGKATGTRTGCCPPCTGWSVTTCWRSPATCTTSRIVQYGVRAVEPPPGAREEWRIFVDLALAMGRPLFGAKGLNGFVRATRRAGPADPAGPALEFGPHWIDRLLVATGRKVNGRRLRWRDVRAHPHGWVLGPRGVRAFPGRAANRRTSWCTPRRPSSSPAHANCWPNRTPAAPGGLPVPAGQPAQPALDELLAQRAARPAPVGQAQRGRHHIPTTPPRSASATATGCGCSPPSARSSWPRRSATGPGAAWSSSTTAGAQGFSIRAAVARPSPTASTAICWSTARRSTRCRRRRR